MANERFLIAIVGIITIFLAILVGCGGLILSMIFMRYIGAPLVFALVDTIGANITAFMIGALFVLLVEGKRNLQASASYQRYQQRQNGISGVLAEYLGMFLNSFLFYAVMGMWYGVASVAFGPWLVSTIVMVGIVIWLDKRRARMLYRSYRKESLIDGKRLSMTKE